MTFLRKPGSAAIPQTTAYRTGQNYPTQENTGNASAPESGGRNPSTQRMSIQDYLQMLGDQLTQVAVDVAHTKALVSEAGDFNQLVRANNFEDDYLIPSPGKWKSCYISRPSFSEVVNTTGLTAKDITIVFDDDFAVIMPFYGQIAIPVFGYTHFKVKNTGPGGAGTYPAGWSIDLMFTSRQYNPTQWAVSAKAIRIKEP